MRIADVQGALGVIRARGVEPPEVAFLLGSGLGEIASVVEQATVFHTTDLPGYPPSTVEGHEGRLVFGRLEGRPVVLVQGRVHLYEGHPVRAVAFPVRLAYALGARRLVVTNAAGGINPRYGPGTLMFITDHINLAFANPLAGPNEDGGPRFPDMSSPFDADWLEQAEGVALRAGIATRRGVYVWTPGPCYETKAEIGAFRYLGADAVGMSTVPEVIQAAYLGMKVLGLSTITNFAAGLHGAPLLHDDVLEVGRRVRHDLERLVRGIVAEL